MAVGGQGLPPALSAAIVASPDGLTWTQQNSGTTNVVLNSVAYGDGQFVAVGNDRNYGVIISSSDGMNWTTRLSAATTATPPVFVSVAYGNGFFVALGFSMGSGQVATSTDGVNWTLTPNGPYFQYASPAMTFGNGMFVAVGGSGSGLVSQDSALIYTSTNGLDWMIQLSKHILAAPLTAFTSVAYGAGQFVAGGGVLDPATGKPAIYTSPDGTNWVARGVPLGLFGVAFGNGQFVGLPGGTNVLRSGVIGKLGASLSPGSGVHGTITGVAGQQYTIQASTNLASWVPLTNVTISTNGTAQFNDAAATNLSRRFYGAFLAQQ